MTALEWGVTLPLAGLALREHRAVVESLPDIGFSQIWSAEGGGIDAFTPLAATAAWAPGLGLGTGIVPVFTRGPAVIAQTAATIAELSGGPLLLGVGASVPAHVSDINGIPFEEPYKRTRDVVRFLSRAFTGEVIGDDFDTFSITGFQLRSLPPVRPKVIVGALRPGMVRLGFRHGDGVITNMLFAEDVPAVAAAAPERRGDSELIVKVFVCPSADDDYARAAVRPFVTWILNQTPYHAFHEWLGRGETLRASHERWLAGDPVGAAAALPDAVLDEVFVHGSPERCRELIARYIQPGVTGIQLYVLSPPGAVRGAADALRLLAALRPSPVAVGS
jgi:probable F420-dependent oxidoreductase